MLITRQLPIGYLWVLGRVSCTVGYCLRMKNQVAGSQKYVGYPSGFRYLAASLVIDRIRVCLVSGVLGAEPLMKWGMKWGVSPTSGGGQGA